MLRYMIPVVLLQLAVFCDEFIPGRIVLVDSDRVKEGLVSDTKDKDIQLFNGAFTQYFKRNEIKSITYLEGDEAQEVSNDVKARQEHRPVVAVEAPKKHEPVKKQDDQTKALHALKAERKKGSANTFSFPKYYPDGDIRNDPMAFILNSAELHISYVGEQPDVRDEIRGLASQIRSATIKSITVREFNLMDKDKQRIISTYFSYIISNK